MGKAATYAALVAATALLAACGSDDGPGDSDSIVGAASGYVTGDSVSVQFVDWAEVRGALGLEDAEGEELFEGLAETRDIGPLYSPGSEPEAEIVGFGLEDLEWEAAIIEEDEPPLAILGVGGDFDYEGVADALAECGYDKAEAGDGTIYSLEEIGQCEDDTGPSFGIPGPALAAIALLPDDDRVLTAASPERIEAALDADGESTLEPVVDDLGETAADVIAGSISFGDLGCSAFSPTGGRFAGRATPEQIEALEEELGDVGEPYESLLVGYTAIGEDTAGRIVLDHESADAADAGLEAREPLFEEATSLVTSQPYTEFLKLDSAETDDDALVFEVSAPDGGPLPLFSLIEQQDLLPAAC